MDLSALADSAFYLFELAVELERTSSPDLEMVNQ